MEHGKESTLQHLPVELLSSIARYLALEDFKSFRLVSRLVSQSTRSLLATEVFSGLLWRLDASRLYELSQIPECARRIRSITFNFARLNEYKALHESFSHHYLIEPELRSEMLHDMWEEYFQSQRQKKANGEFRLDLVKKAFRSLPSLKEVTLTWTQCPWDRESEACRLFSADVSIRMAKREVFDIQDAIMRVMWQTGTKLDALNLEPIPLKGLSEELYPDDGPSSAMDLCIDEDRVLDQSSLKLEFFQSLRRLNLVLDRKSESWIEIGLENVLCQTTNLKELRLEYLPWVRVRTSTWFLDRIFIRNLEVLEVVNPEVGLQNLAVCLARHHGKLKRLELVGVKGIRSPDEDDVSEDLFTTNHDPLDGESSEVDTVTKTQWTDVHTWEDFFTTIRERLENLENVRVSGSFTDPESGGKCWFFHDAKEVGRASPENVWLTPARPMETFLLGEGEMPELKFWADGM